jgi:hypothetical protein
MPASYTANLHLALPQVDVDAGWGTTLNNDFDLIDDLFNAAGDGTSIGLNVGTGKTLTIGGEMVLGTGDDTNTVTAPVIRGAARTGTNVAGTNLTIQAANGTGNGGSGNIIFQTAAPSGGSGSSASNLSDTLVINANKDIGIAVSAPTSRLHVRDDSNSLNVIGQFQNKNTQASASGILAFINSNTELVDNRYAYMGARTTGAGQNGNYLVFGTNTNGGTPTERMRIASTGAVGFDGDNYGTAGQVLTSAGDAAVPTWEDSAAFTAYSSASLSAAATATFTGISSAAESLQIVFHRVKSSVTDENILIQLGTGSTPTYANTGYITYANTSSSTSSPALNEDGFPIKVTSTSAEYTGIVTISRMYGDVWDCSYCIVNTGTSPAAYVGGGSKVLSANLTAIKIKLSGDSTFTSGNVRLLYLR